MYQPRGINVLQLLFKEHFQSFADQYEAKHAIIYGRFRIERVTEGDRRSQLRAAVPRIPQTAPAYFVYCATAADRWQLLEAGYCAAGALLQATSIGLQGYFTAGLTSAERTAISNALETPGTDLPLMVVSAGQAGVGIGSVRTDAVQLFSIHPNPFTDRTDIKYTVESPAHLRLAIYDQNGRRLRTLKNKAHAAGSYSATWDGTDEQGRTMPEGNYYAVIRTASKEYRRKITKVR